MTRYGEEIMKITRDTSFKRVNKLHVKVVERNDVEHDMWIVPVL